MIPSYRTKTRLHWSAVVVLVMLATSCAEQAAAPDSGSIGAEDAPAPVVLTLYADGAQLFLEYPQLVAGEEARFLAHVSLLEAGLPMTAGKAWVEVGPAAAPWKTFVAEEPKQDGLFIPLVRLEESGSMEARLVVQGPEMEATFLLPDLQVFPDAVTAEASTPEPPEVEDAVPFLLEQMWSLRMKHEPVTRRKMTEWLQVPGRVDARPDSLSLVGAPVDGLLVQQDEHAHIGDWVEEGAFLGFVEAPLTTSDRAQLEAVRTDLLAREMELEAKQIEIEKDLLQAQAERDFALPQVERLVAMREKGLGTEVALESARRDLALAESRVEGSNRLLASFGETRARLQVLRQDLVDGLGGSDGSAMRYPLLAPISGEIAAVEAHQGDPVKGQETLFTILRSDRVWIEAEVSEFDLGHLSEPKRGRLHAPILGDRLLDLELDLNGSLIHVGRMVDPLDRTVSLRFEVDNPERRMPLGMFVDVLLATGFREDALAVPASAIVRDLGVDVVYVVASGETMQRREVETGLRDGGFVEILSGVEEGERIIVTDAFRVRLASASPAEFGHGHTH